MGRRILAINPGSTSTKIALYDDDTELVRQELPVEPDTLVLPFMLDQLESRASMVDKFLHSNGIGKRSLDIIVARGGSLNGVESGPYAIDRHVLTILERAPRTQHLSSLASFIAYRLSEVLSVPCIFYDSPSASDAMAVLHYTGMPEAKRWASDHCLNSKAVAREVAASIGKTYETSDILVAHLGGGITLSFHSGGKMADTIEDDAGPMSPQRAGRVPSQSLIEMCFSGKYAKREMLSKMRGKGGLLAYLGVSDARDVEAMIAQGNELARDLFWYMAYQISKGIGEMSVVNSGKLDRIVLTGGLAYSKTLTDWIVERVSFLAPVVIIPGEREMLALAQGGLRVLSGEERLKHYRWLPYDCATLEDVVSRYEKGDISLMY